MIFYQYLILLIVLSAAFAYFNQRFIRLPFVIGLFLLATVLSLGLLVIRWFAPWKQPYFEKVIQDIRISNLITDVMLAFLLFAGAMHTDWSKLRSSLRPVLFLAVVGTLLSTFLIAGMLYGITHWLDVELPFLYCLIFGALISPTDPIAVLGILKKARVPEKIENTIVGESLFNDGIGIVFFIVLTGMIGNTSGSVTAGHIGGLFLQEVGGGIGAGLLMGYLLHWLLRSIDHYETEILLTLAAVMGGYWLCAYWHLSGPLAMVVMGLMVGNFRPGEAMTDITQGYVHKFWELADVILNAVLFILIALVMVLIPLYSHYWLLGLLSIVVILLSRVLVVTIHRRFFPLLFGMNRAASKVIIWGGLRGGLSLALVLSLPESPYKPVLSAASYIVVVFSILVQGLTIGSFAQKVLANESDL